MCAEHPGINLISAPIARHNDLRLINNNHSREHIKALIHAQRIKLDRQPHPEDAAITEHQYEDEEDRLEANEVVDSEAEAAEDSQELPMQRRDHMGNISSPILRTARTYPILTIWI
jgi:Spy/CpxP family protein refolding chaperone